MSQQQPTPSAARVVRDVAALLCLVAALVIVNVVAWLHGVSTGLLAAALDLGVVGVALGSSR
jgi:hypothetical protein